MHCTNHNCPTEQECAHRLPPENGSRFQFNPVPMGHDRCHYFQCRHSQYKAPPYNGIQQCHFCLVKLEVKPRIHHAYQSLHPVV